ncbi:hypothetical protein [Microbacterium oxydans]|uniref:hypothetical protein n=1 Tax=Microbacterium oxydans TaxID=82380 RepID=UPI0012DFEC5B|nr:hypothetical protein [Microbacterium oxydans]
MTTTTEDVALEGCDPSAASQAGLCDGIEIVTEQRFTLGTDQATKAADELGMNRAETSSFVAKAAAGAVQGATWTHSYWAGTVKEVHAGTTYWDGSYAWVGTYRGLTGEHTCGKPGSYAVGATVSDRKCPKPGASSKADSVETFNLALATPIPANFTVGLHNAYTKGGVRSTWQVGG